MDLQIYNEKLTRDSQKGKRYLQQVIVGVSCIDLGKAIE